VVGGSVRRQENRLLSLASAIPTAFRALSRLILLTVTGSAAYGQPAISPHRRRFPAPRPAADVLSRRSGWKQGQLAPDDLESRRPAR
jgi:hypothetical protein